MYGKWRNIRRNDSSVFMLAQLCSCGVYIPDYYEEGKENTPARIIDIVYHGTGYKYRNCFLYRQIQFEKYDAVFPFAAAQESASVCISIIRSRLRSGPEPKEEWKYRYIDYLRSEKELLIDTILADTEYRCVHRTCFRPEAVGCSQFSDGCKAQKVCPAAKIEI